MQEYRDLYSVHGPVLMDDGVRAVSRKLLYQVILYSPCHVANLLALYSYTPRTQHKYTPFTGFDLLRLTTLALHTRIPSAGPGPPPDTRVPSVLTLVSFL